MPKDKPIAFTQQGKPLYDNTPTVVAVIVEDTAGNVFAVRRANDPGRGLLGLPAGYHMRGESWREAGAREVFEETGLQLHEVSDIGLLGMETDEYGNNVVIARYFVPVLQEPAPQDGEALEVVRIGTDNLVAEDWAFPMHYHAVADYLHIHRLYSQSGY